METMKGMINLNKYLASCGTGSRRHCDELIKRGEVKVNGECAYTGMKVDPARDKIAVKGKGDIINAYQPEMYYLMLNKPCGYLTTMSDPLDRPSIKDLLPDMPERIYPVGRLDFNSEGLLLLTNDGDFAYRLSHPKFMISKTYLVKVKGRPSTIVLNKLRKGIKLQDGWASLDSIKVIKSRSIKNTWLIADVHEGRNRLIRRMFTSAGYPVIKLKRMSFGGIHLDTLKPKEWRYLSRKELKTLKEATAMIR